MANITIEVGLAEQAYSFKAIASDFLNTNSFFFMNSYQQDDLVLYSQYGFLFGNITDSKEFMVINEYIENNSAIGYDLKIILNQTATENSFI